MKNILACAVLVFGLLSVIAISKQNGLVMINNNVDEKFDIKIINDTGADVKVINAVSAVSYSLTKNETTTIKMEEADKLYFLEKGKKGTLILIAAEEMDGKVQFLSKL